MIPGGTPESRDRRHPMSQQAREKAAHPREYVRELGYERAVCGTCRTDWPCADAARASEAQQVREVAALDRGLTRSPINHRVWWCPACLNSGVDLDHEPGSEDCQTAAYERAWSQADE